MTAAVGTDLNIARHHLEQFGLVAIPTETVYGLAANGLEPLAVTKIFEAKNRPHFDPLILHIGHLGQLQSLVTAIPPKAQKLMDAFWPGPLTLILPKSDLVPDLVTSGNQGVGIRMPNHSLTLELLKSLSFPLAAPSANPFGYVSPTTAKHVVDQLGAKIDYVIDGGPCKIGLESSIVSFVENTPKILRLGGLTQEQIEAVIGPVALQISNNSNPLAPGQLDQHYSPKCSLYPMEEIGKNSISSKAPTLVFFSPKTEKSFEDQHPEIMGKFDRIYFSPSHKISEAASRLFSILRDLDQENQSIAFIEMAPENGLGIAINDRLQRAMKQCP